MDNKDVFSSTDSSHAATSPGSTRRTFLRGLTATAGGVIAASYVKPSLSSLGITQALAAASSGITIDPTLFISISSSSCQASAVTATLRIDNPNGNLGVSAVKVEVEVGSIHDCGSAVTPALTQLGTTGGPFGPNQPLTDGTLLPGGTTSSFSIKVTGVFPTGRRRLHVSFALGGVPFHVCRDCL